MDNKEFKKEINIVVEMGIVEFAKKNNISLDDIINQTIEKADILIKDLRPLNSVTFNLPINGCDCIWKIRLETIPIVPDKGGNYTFTLVDLRLTENIPDIWGVKRENFYYFNKKISDILGRSIVPGEYVSFDKFSIFDVPLVKITSPSKGSKKSYLIKESDLENHFEKSSLVELTIADKTTQYNLTNTEYNILKIFLDIAKDSQFSILLSTLDIEKFKEKLIEIKEID